MSKKLETGDYVLATKYGDGDPQDEWAVGFFSGTLPKAGGDRFLVSNGEGILFRANGFRRVKKISAKRGRWILDHKHAIDVVCGGGQGNQ